ncbi:MAG: hypothetical protein QF860_03275, partial [Planctomycetota bacterium]|nr:hypothetical protein [Planctomycetota bacterium]
AWDEEYESNNWVWAEAQRTQLLGWSFNSIAYLSTIGWTESRDMWTDTRLYTRIEMPYTATIFFVAHGDIDYAVENDGYVYEEERYPDVWSDDWFEKADLRAEKVCGRVAADPFLLGYYMGSEPAFQYTTRGGWIDRLIGLEEDAPGKQQWVELMAELYADADDFNAVYEDSLGWSIVDFDDLYDVTDLGLVKPDAAAFMFRIADRYGSVTKAKTRKYDPEGILFGPRFDCSKDNVSKTVLDALEPYTDAWCFNDYGERMDTWDDVYAFYGKPVLISEFTYLGDDTGFNNAPYPRVPDQRARGTAYRDRVTKVAARDYTVGIYFHAYYDHGPDGRWRNWGLVDPILDEPYGDMIQHVVPTNELVFELHRGNAPTDWWKRPDLDYEPAYVPGD